MALKHEVKDADVHFVVDADSRKIIKQTSTKVSLMQYDHNSEEFTFDVPRYIETHDMSQCDLIQVHYENTSVGTSVSTRKTYRGIKNIDLDTITVNEETIALSWLVPENATTFAGVLKFQLKFICNDSEDGTEEGYKWHSDVNEDISIKAGLGYTEEDMTPATTATLQSIEIVDTGSSIDIILDGTRYKLYHTNGVAPSNMESTTNKVTSISETSTDEQYPSALAVYTAIKNYVANNASSGSLPTIASGDNGKIIEIANGTYVLKAVSASSVATYITSLKTTTIDENSTDERLPTAKAVYDLLISTSVTTSLTDITILASNWVGTNSPYSQVVQIAGVTEYSKVDLQPSVEQLAIFHEKDLAFVTENEDGVVTVYAIGDKPANDYKIQATITEVVV